jgi:hypothetical protein
MVRTAVSGIDAIPSVAGVTRDDNGKHLYHVSYKQSM